MFFPRYMMSCSGHKISQSDTNELDICGPDSPIQCMLRLGLLRKASV